MRYKAAAAALDAASRLLVESGSERRRLVVERRMHDAYREVLLVGQLMRVGPAALEGPAA
jgi:hypothetical protein